MKKKSKSSVMDYDVFANKYSKQIDSLIDKILSQRPGLNDATYDSFYDDAHEEAVFVLAKEKNVVIG